MPPCICATATTFLWRPRSLTFGRPMPECQPLNSSGFFVMPTNAMKRSASLFLGVVLSLLSGAVTSRSQNVIYTPVQGAGAVTKDPEASSYPVGATVLLSATPGRYYRFSQWGDGTNDNPRLITVGAEN